jgi:hypothetical protein
VLLLRRALLTVMKILSVSMCRVAVINDIKEEDWEMYQIGLAAINFHFF